MESILLLGNEICRFHKWMRKWTKTVPNVQSKLVYDLVDVMRLMGIEYMVGCLAVLMFVMNCKSLD